MNEILKVYGRFESVSRFPSLSLFLGLNRVVYSFLSSMNINYLVVYGATLRSLQL